MIVVSIRNIEWRDQASLYWSFLWRLLAATAGSLVLAGIIGNFSGIVFNILAAMRGLERHAMDMPILIAGGLVGALVALVSFYFLLRWLLKSKLGQYRLVLVEAGEVPDTTLAGFRTSSLRTHIGRLRTR
jgi:hypothetical protein